MTTMQPEDVSRTTGKDELEKWNWGAFLWGVIWAFGHRLWKQALLGLLVSIVTLGLASIVVQVWYALKGNRWIWDRGGYGSREELRRKERAWAWAYLWVMLVIVAIWVLAVVAAG